MDRVRRKETIGNNPQRRTRSKKHDKTEEKYLFSSIPVELIIEILLKLPAKSIAKLMFVSKYWSSIVRDKDFTELYLTRSFTRPGLLFTVDRKGMQFFYSRSLKDLSSDHHHRLTITTHHDSWYQFSPPIRGLICCLYGLKVLIGNPSTGQFITLPRVKTKSFIIYSFFGYDPVNDLYKVLCITGGRYVPSGGEFGSISTEEHQVFTLGDKQKWRMIECKHRHSLAELENRGICMNGVLYYLAKINDEQSRSLISFNLGSEDFSVIKLPEDIRHRWSNNLVNYSGKIALTNYTCNGTLDVWVQKDAGKQEWSKASSLLVPSWTNLVENQMFKFRGTLSTGELIFVPCSFPKPFFLICYDLKENNARKVVIEGIGNDFATVFLDHIESPMFLPKVCQSDED